MDYHQTPAAYKEAKAKLFQNWPLAAAVINSNDAVGRELLCTSRANEVISYGTHGDLTWRSETVRQGMRVSFSTPWGRDEAVMPVAAEFAVDNVAAAMAVLLTLGHSLHDVVEAVEAMVPVPGRMQIIDGGPKWPRVVVDYAHTPDALEKAFCDLAQKHNAKTNIIKGEALLDQNFPMIHAVGRAADQQPLRPVQHHAEPVQA